MALETLCLACGLCCDGTLFRHVALDPGEREALVPLGVPLRERRGRDWMALPCGKLEGTKCTVYGQRPQGCRRFVCDLGRRLQGRAVTLDAALAVVAEVRAALAVLAKELPPQDGEPVLRHARACIDAPGTPVGEAALEAFRRVEDLRYREFMPPPSGG